MTNVPQANAWIYLDNNATTRVDERVVEAMLPLFRDNFANPSSVHALGGSAAETLRVARGQVRSLIGAAFEKEIVFTSGGSESNNTAVLSALETQPGRDEIVISAVEHPSILAVCAHLELSGRARVFRIPVDRGGNLDIEAYRRALSDRTALVSCQWANNETGVISRVEMLAAMAHQVGALFHCDAVQAAGKIAIDVQSADIDLLTLTAHKLHGPKGIAALYVRNGVRLAPLIRGGRQERGHRAGTENSPAIAGFGLAAELAAQTMPDEMPRIARLRDRLEFETLRLVPGSLVIGSKSNRLPNTLNIAFEGAEADSILLLLERASIAASSGSACAAGSMEPSHVLRAMKVPFSHLRGAVRFSFSRENAEDEVDRVLNVLPQIANELHARSVSLEAAYD
jgi:cysteine desulfurase